MILSMPQPATYNHIWHISFCEKIFWLELKLLKSLNQLSFLFASWYNKWELWLNSSPIWLAPKAVILDAGETLDIYIAINITFLFLFHHISLQSVICPDNVIESLGPMRCSWQDQYDHLLHYQMAFAQQLLKTVLKNCPRLRKHFKIHSNWSKVSCLLKRFHWPY